MRLMTSLVALLFAPALICVAPAVSQQSIDSVKVDPAHHKVEFENAQVRVLRWIIPPGDKTLNHSHFNNVNICLSDYNGRVTTPDGKTRDVHDKAGSTTWREAGVHIVENIADQPMTGIIVEPKKPFSARPAGAQDVVVADPKHNQVVFENEQVRVIRDSWGPGEKSPMHGHPDSVQVLLTDLKMNMTTADGKTSLIEGKAGEVRWRPATQHAAENVSGKAFEQILIEMKGAPKAPTGGR